MSRVSKEIKKQERAIERRVESAVVRAVKNPAQTARNVTTGVGTALGVGVKSGAAVALNAALVIAAGVGSYFATTWVINQLKRTPADDLADLNLIAANGYREARREAEKKLNTPWAAIDPRVQQELKRSFDHQLARNADYIRNRTMIQARANIAQYQSQLGR